MLSHIIASLAKDFLISKSRVYAYWMFGGEMVGSFAIALITIATGFLFVGFLIYGLYCLLQLVDYERRRREIIDGETWTPPRWAAWTGYIVFAGGIMLGLGVVWLGLGPLRDSWWIFIPVGLAFSGLSGVSIYEIRTTGWFTNFRFS